MSASEKPQADVAAKVALVSLGILGAMLLIVIVASAGLWFAFEARQPLRVAARALPPNPRLEVVGGADLAAVRRLGARRLEGWGWTDRKAALAHVPIERAVQLTAQRGWADAEPAP